VPLAENETAMGDLTALVDNSAQVGIIAAVERKLDDRRRAETTCPCSLDVRFGARWPRPVTSTVWVMAPTVIARSTRWRAFTLTATSVAVALEEAFVLHGDRVAAHPDVEEVVVAIVVGGWSWPAIAGIHIGERDVGLWGRQPPRRHAPCPEPRRCRTARRADPPSENIRSTSVIFENLFIV